MDFNTAFERLIGHEKGFVIDNGGPTKYGISQRSYPEYTEDQIRNLTLDQARAHYVKDYWGPAGCDVVPDLVKFDHFDMAVNSSARGRPVTAIKILQRAAGMPKAEVDGVLGPRSLLAMNSMNPWRLLHRLTGERIVYYTHLRDALWDEAGKGWMNRVAANALAS